MANVRGFDARGRPNGNQPAENTILADRGIMDFDETPTKDPRKESYCEMFRLNLCPKLYWHSFCTLICLLDVVAFGLQIYFDPINKPGRFLEFVPTGRVMLNFGRTDEAVRKKKQVYRLVTSLFLHASFNHIFNNVVSTLIWGSLVEKLIGKWRTALIYIASGIIGNLFSSVFMKPEDLAVGASTAIFSFFGCLLGIVFLNWFRFERHRFSLSKVVITVAVILLLNVAALSSDKSVDNYAHGGGFAAGVLLSMVLGDLQEEHEESQTTPYEKRVKLLGVFLAIAYTAGSACYYFLLK